MIAQVAGEFFASENVGSFWRIPDANRDFNSGVMFIVYKVVQVYDVAGITVRFCLFIAGEVNRGSEGLAKPLSFGCLNLVL